MPDLRSGVSDFAAGSGLLAKAGRWGRFRVDLGPLHRIVLQMVLRTRKRSFSGGRLARLAHVD